MGILSNPPTRVKTHYISKQKFVEEYPGLFTASELDYLIRIRKANDLEKAIRKIGKRKILISVPQFFEWLDNQSS